MSRASKTGLETKIKAFIITLVLITLPIIFILDISDTSSKGLIGSTHDFTSTGPGGQNFPYGICQACHTPHMAQDIRLWKRPSAVGVSFNDNDSRRMCLDCHGYDQLNMATQLPSLTGVTWGAGGLTPPQITSKDGNVFFNQNHATGRDNCKECHTHPKFLPKCNGCHGYPPGTDYEPSVTCPPAMVGAIQESPSSGDECNTSATEVGAHLFHTIKNTSLNDGNGNPYSGPPHNYGDPNLNPGYPKLGFNCLSSGCHDSLPGGDHNLTVDDRRRSVGK